MNDGGDVACATFIDHRSTFIVQRSPYTPLMAKKHEPRSGKSARLGRWVLKDAKDRLNEVVEKAKTEGPQRIIVDGREEAVVISVNEYDRIESTRTGRLLVDLLENSPLRDVEL